MSYDPERHHRRTTRWEGYDYALAGMYVVTIVTANRRHLLGSIADEVMTLSAAGRIVQDVWFGLTERFPTVGLDAFVVMPNHVHGIVVLNESSEPEQGFPQKGRASPAPTDGPNQTTSHEASAVRGREIVGEGLAPPLPPAPAVRPSKPTLGNVVGAYKSLSAIAANRVLGTSGRSFWQRGYHDRVIRNDNELDTFRWYIGENPVAWPRDREYVAD